jgi:hypothetical protein
LSLSIFKLFGIALDDTPACGSTCNARAPVHRRRVSSNGKIFVTQKRHQLSARLLGFTEAGGGSVLLRARKSRNVSCLMVTF